MTSVLVVSCSPFLLTNMFGVWLTLTSMSATSCLEKKSMEEDGSELRILGLVEEN